MSDFVIVSYISNRCRDGVEVVLQKYAFQNIDTYSTVTDFIVGDKEYISMKRMLAAFQMLNVRIMTKGITLIIT